MRAFTRCALCADAVLSRLFCFRTLFDIVAPKTTLQSRAIAHFPGPDRIYGELANSESEPNRINGLKRLWHCGVASRVEPRVFDVAGSWCCRWITILFLLLLLLAQLCWGGCTVVIEPGIFTSIESTTQVINGNSYGVYSIQKNDTGTLYRFEVHEGEGRVSGGDAGKERSELNGGTGTAQDFPHGTSIWVAYCFMVEPGAALLGAANVLGQFHAGISSPNLSIRVPTDAELKVHMNFGNASALTKLIGYTGLFQRGKWYRVVMNAKFTSDATGFVKVWIDGTQVVNLLNRVTGYFEEQSTSNYWKFGIYRSTSSLPTEVVQLNDMRLGTSDLSQLNGQLCCDAASVVTSTAPATSAAPTSTAVLTTAPVTTCPLLRLCLPQQVCLLLRQLQPQVCLPLQLCPPRQQ